MSSKYERYIHIFYYDNQKQITHCTRCNGLIPEIQTYQKCHKHKRQLKYIHIRTNLPGKGRNHDVWELRSAFKVVVIMVTAGISMQILHF